MEHIDINILIWGSVIGTLGFALFIYGKKRADIPSLVLGVVLMVYPYFVSSLAWNIAAGVVLVAAYVVIKVLM